MFPKILDWLAGNSKAVFIFLGGFALGVILSNLGWFLK